MTTVFLILGALTLMFCRVPVAIALLVPSLFYLVDSTTLSMGVAIQRFVAGIDSYVLLAIPLFVLAANLMNVSAVTDRIFDFLHVLTGWMRGGLAYANIGSSVVFSGMSGSAVADAAGLGAVEIRAMRKHGYEDDIAIGVTGASCLIGPIIPPSIPAVIYGVASGVSIGALFIAGVLPGLIMAAAIAIMVFFTVRRRGYSKGPLPEPKAVVLAFGRAIPPLLAPVILLGGIFSGLFTPTEAAGVTVGYAAILGIVYYRSVNGKQLVETLIGSVVTSAQILFILGSASLFAWILAYERVPQTLTEVMLGLTDKGHVFLLLAVGLMLALGMILEPTPAILIVTPILLPAVESYGISPLHFGVVMILAFMIGLLTPPVGNVLYILQGIARVRFVTVLRATAPFTCVLALVLLVITFVPWITLYLPSLFGHSP